MKRNGVVVNKKSVKEAKGILDWGKTGMNWEIGKHRSAVIAASISLMAKGPGFLDSFYRMLEKYLEKGGYWQTPVSLAILAANDPKKSMALIRDLDNGYDLDCEYTLADLVSEAAEVGLKWYSKSYETC